MGRISVMKYGALGFTSLILTRLVSYIYGFLQCKGIPQYVDSGPTAHDDVATHLKEVFSENFNLLHL